MPSAPPRRHLGMISPVNIFDFHDDEDPSVVYLGNGARWGIRTGVRSRACH
jgi:hypothetical protein